MCVCVCVLAKLPRLSLIREMAAPDKSKGDRREQSARDEKTALGERVEGGTSLSWVWFAERDSEDGVRAG